MGFSYAACVQRRQSPHKLEKLALIFATAIFAVLGTAQESQAQNLAITNARIIVGNGQVIEHGGILVRDGRIAAVVSGEAPAVPAGTQTIDASGFTVMPGFIDDHRHLIGRADNFFENRANREMMELLESGVTTVQSGGDPFPAIVQLKQKIESGEIKGPRIVAPGPLNFNKYQTVDELRSAIDEEIKAGAESLGEVHFPQATFPAEPTEKETAFLKVAIDEGKKFGVPVQIHAVSPSAMLDAVRDGGTELIHTPHFGWLTDEDAQTVKNAGALVSSCAGFGAPVFDVFNHDNIPTFRDGKPWPSAIIDGQGRGREAGYKPVNGRTLFDNGVVYGYCTDTTYQATAALAQELRVLNLMFSPIDLIKIMGPNSADVIGKSKDIGTLEAGKLADIVVLTGNPLEGYWNLLTDVMTIKGGLVLVDKRSELQTIKVLPAPR
jgi:imidazolonepropionase-like amidohydrolase